ncbi:hypothetical protein [Ornithinimicrobium faecis]|uniref:hypothetical protein n=1 Tax=Ornithinimicrobium faecis TaxID=2934158 RepID=UPI002118D7FA|nr:hypothetical protein [Ornithinimicrobium sp. HY1745]
MRMLNRTRVRHGVVVCLLLAVSTTGCSATDGNDHDGSPTLPARDGVPTSAQGVAEAGPVARIAAGEKADLFLYVSNQSFYHDRVPIEVTIDGVTIVDQQFDVQGQHTWIQFPVALETRTVLVTATVASDPAADREIQVSETFPLNVPPGDQRWMTISYWASEPEPTPAPEWEPRIYADIADIEPGFD